MVSFKLTQGMGLSDDEKKMLKEAFIKARRRNPYKVEPITVYVSSETIEKAKTIGEDYMEILGRLMDQAVNDYIWQKAGR